MSTALTNANIKATQLPTYSVAPLLNWVLDSACLPLLPFISLIHPFSDLAHFRSFWTLSLPSSRRFNPRLDFSTQLIASSSNPHHDSHENASMHSHFWYFSFSIRCQFCFRGSCGSTRGT